MAWGEHEPGGLFTHEPGLTLLELRSLVADDPGASAPLRAMLSDLGEVAGFASLELDDDALCERVFDAIERGRLRVRVEPYTPMSSHAVEDLALPVPVAHTEREYEDDSHWVEIELLDEEDQPVIGERCRIVLPDGREVHSQTDEDGLVRVERCVAGQCQVFFPSLDAEAVAPLVAYDDWIEIELLDDQEQPVVGERCRIVMPDGRELSARSDRDGLVRVERCATGECQIYFPDLDADVVAPLN